MAIKITTNSFYDTLHPHGRPLSNVTALPCIANIDDTGISRVVAAGIVNSASQILVGFSTKRQVWDIPQGGVEAGEGLQTAIQRELKEEINLFVPVDNLEIIATFSHKAPAFVFAWETTLFGVHCNYLNFIENLEPDKCSKLMWAAPSQIPEPRGLSLRIFLDLLGR